MQMKRKMTFAVIAVLFCFLTGCGKESATAGPVFGEDCRGYDGFSCLEEVTLETGKDSVTLFLPKDTRRHPDKESAGNYCDGISIRIGLTAWPSGNVLPLAQCRGWALEKCRKDQLIRASGFHMGQAQYLTENAVRIPVSYYEVYGKNLRVDRTYYIRQLDENTVFFMEVSVSDYDITRQTAKILEELEHFYQFEIACNKKQIQLVSRLAQQKAAPGPYIRIRCIRITADMKKQICDLLQTPDQKKPAWIFPGEHENPLHIENIRTLYGKNYFLAAMWIHGRDSLRTCRIYFSCCASSIWLLEMGKQ